MIEYFELKPMLQTEIIFKLYIECICLLFFIVVKHNIKTFFGGDTMKIFLSFVILILAFHLCLMGNSVEASPNTTVGASESAVDSQPDNTKQKT